MTPLYTLRIGQFFTRLDNPHDTTKYKFMGISKRKKGMAKIQSEYYETSFVNPMLEVKPIVDGY